MYIIITSKMLIKMIVLFMVANTSAIKMEGKIVHGEKASIREFPYSVFLKISKSQGTYICGSSIVNQKIVLTAAHCVEVCRHRCKKASAIIGHEYTYKGLIIHVKAAIIHPGYRSHSVENDIGLAVLHKKIRLGKLAQRIAIFRNPKIKGLATVAGWGIVDEENDVGTNHLHYIKQKIMALSDCRAYISTVPDGCFCTGNMKNQHYASLGDSGSALVIRNYVQIGIVSFKRPDISRGIVVYTNVSYYYDWIKISSRKLYCDYL